MRFGSFGSPAGGEGGRGVARHAWEMHDGMMLVHEMDRHGGCNTGRPFFSSIPVARKSNFVRRARADFDRRVCARRLGAGDRAERGRDDDDKMRRMRGRACFAQARQRWF